MDAEQYCTYVETWCALCVFITVTARVCPGSNGPVAPARGQQVEQGGAGWTQSPMMWRQRRQVDVPQGGERAGVDPAR